MLVVLVLLALPFFVLGYVFWLIATEVLGWSPDWLRELWYLTVTVGVFVAAIYLMVTE